tara:strand:+ start:3010 stop:6228 length:3219 start_codon:yes stop_codon:yes gene_type:complete
MATVFDSLEKKNNIEEVEIFGTNFNTETGKRKKKIFDPFEKKEEEQIISPDDELLQSTPPKQISISDPFIEKAGVAENIYRTGVGILRDTTQGVVDFTDWVEGLVPRKFRAGIVKTQEDGYQVLFGEEYSSAVDQLRSQGIKAINLPKIPEPTYAGGSLVRDIGGFLIPFSRLKMITPVSKLGKGAEVVARGAIAERLAFSPYEDRLSNLIEQYPKLKNPVTNYLKADPDDSENLATFKMAIEGAGFGKIVQSVIGLSQFVGRSIKAKYPSLDTPQTKTGEPITPKEQPSANKDLKLSERIEEISKPLQDVSMSKTQIQPGLLGNNYQRMATKAIDFTKKIFPNYSPLKTLPRQDKYLTLRNLTGGKLRQVKDLAEKNYETFSKLDVAQNLQVKKYLLKEEKLSSIKDPNIQTQAKQLRDGIDKIGKELEKAGILSKEVVNKGEGSYLPRMYLKYFEKSTRMGYTKSRKELSESARKFLGEIEDVSLLGSKAIGDPMSDIVRYGFFEKITQDPNWTFKGGLVKFGDKDVSPIWLKQEANRISREIDDGLRPAADRSMVKSMNKLIDDAEMNINKADLELYDKLPDTKQYGTLRGSYVRREIHGDLVGAGQFADPKSGFAQAFLGDYGFATQATKLWKLSKVALNPPTQVRNFMSNIILLNLSGIRWRDMPKRLIRGIKSIKDQDAYYQIAKKYGVIDSTFSRQEMIEINKAYLKARAAKGNFIDKTKYIGGVIADFGTRAYQGMEVLGKTTKIIDDMAKGVDEANAALNAQKTLFDYSLIPSSVRYLRNAPVGMPFLTFYYKVLPNLLETAVRYPERYAPYVALPYAYHSILSAYKGITNEDFEKLKQTLPEYLRNKGDALAMPVKDNQGRWQFLDISYYMPWAMFTGMAKDIKDFKLQNFVKSSGLFGAPLSQLIAATLTNKDPFTQRTIVNEFDPPETQAANLMLYLYRMSMPTWLTDIGFAGKLLEVINKDVNKYGDPKITATQTLGRLFGANIYSIDPQRSRAENIKRMRNELSSIKSRRTSTLKDSNLTAEERKKISDKYIKKIKERAKQIKEYAESSEVPEALLRD